MLIARPGKVRAGLRAQDLHVAREHEELAVGALEELGDAALLLVLAAFAHRKVVVRHAVPFGEAAEVLVVRDDRDDVHRQRARRPAVQHAVQAVAGLRHAHDDAAPLAQVANGPGHVERRRHARRELALELLDRRHALAVVVKHGPHE